MAKEYIVIGSSPYDETCAQVGSPDYAERSAKELKAYVNQLSRVYKDLPDGCRIGIKSFNHDFGAYREVVCYYDPDAEATAMAFEMEAGCANWDALASKELASC